MPESWTCLTTDFSYFVRGYRITLQGTSTSHTPHDTNIQNYRCDCHHWTPICIRHHGRIPENLTIVSGPDICCHIVDQHIFVKGQRFTVKAVKQGDRACIAQLKLDNKQVGTVSSKKCEDDIVKAFKLIMQIMDKLKSDATNDAFPGFSKEYFMEKRKELLESMD